MKRLIQPDFLNIVFVPGIIPDETIDRVESVGKLEQLTNVNSHGVVLLYDDDNIIPLFKSLPRETKIIFWIHAGVLNNGNLQNRSCLFNITEKLRKLNYFLKPYFITADVLNLKNFTKKNEISYLMPLTSDEEVYFEETLLYNFTALSRIGNIKHLPERQTIGEILSPPKKEDIIFNYNLENDDTKIWLFEQNATVDELKWIIGYLIKDYSNHSEAEVNILTPGFSGAQVFLLTYKKDNRHRSVIVKMDKNRNHLVREIKIKKDSEDLDNLDNNIFIFPKQDEPIGIGNWFILTYRNALNSKALSKFIEEADFEKILTIALDDFQNFEKVLGQLKLKQIRNIWHHKDNLEYNGLKLNKWTTSQVISNMKSLFPFLNNLQTQDFKKQLELEKDKNKKVELKNKINLIISQNKKYKDVLENFIQSDNKYRGELIGKDIRWIPTAKVHRDFHSDNIMVNEDKNRIYFIDFALTSEQPHDHAFLDIAKLSVNIELKLMPDELFVCNPNSNDSLKEWIRVHKTWIKGKTPSTSIPELEKIIKLQSFWLDRIKAYTQRSAIKKTKYGLTEEALQASFVEQFMFTRLHYLLKTMTYHSFIIEKRLFVLQASIDLLEHFIE